LFSAFYTCDSDLGNILGCGTSPIATRFEFFSWQEIQAP